MNMHQLLQGYGVQNAPSGITDVEINQTLNTFKGAINCNYNFANLRRDRGAVVNPLDLLILIYSRSLPTNVVDQEMTRNLNRMIMEVNDRLIQQSKLTPAALAIRDCCASHRVELI